MGKVTPEYRQLAKLFNSLTGSKGMWQVFNDCMEIFALSLQNLCVFDKRHADNENRYKDIIKNYTNEELAIITKTFAEITTMLKGNPFRDLLGDLYMQLDFGSDALGQFFTPYSAAQTMAKASIAVPEIKNSISKKGYITIGEPSVGGGANVIAFCEYLHENNINYQEHCVIVCQELSKLTGLMCYIALSLMGCSAVIKIGDSLIDPYTNYYNELKQGSELWITPMFHINNCYGKC